MTTEVEVPTIKGYELLKRIVDNTYKIWRYRLLLPKDKIPEGSHGILYEIVLPMSSGTELECLEAFLVDNGETKDILEGFDPEASELITGELMTAIHRAMIQSWHKLFISVSQQVNS